MKSSTKNIIIRGFLYVAVGFCLSFGLTHLHSCSVAHADLIVQQPDPYQVIVTEVTPTSGSSPVVTPTAIPTIVPTPVLTATAVATPVGTNLILSPVNGQIVSGIVNIVVTGLPNHWRYIYINGKYWMIITNFIQYTAQWDSRTVPNGPATITIKSDNVTTVGLATVTVQN